MTMPAFVRNALLCGVMLWAVHPDHVTAEPTVAPSIEHNAKPGQSDPMAFDIPAQPLAAAIEIYGNVARVQVVYDARLAEGHSSVEIKGLFTAEAALQALLKGTGLMAVHTGRDALVIVAAPATRSAAEIGAAVLRDANASERRYYALIQTGISSAFCHNGDARPAGDRVVVSLWIDASGTVQRYRVLGAGAEDGREQAIEAVLRRVAIGEPPPAGMAQPFTIVILPRPAGSGCP